MLASRTASLGELNYAPDTPLSLNMVVGDDFNMSGVTVEFEAKAYRNVVFKCTNGSGIIVDGQNISLEIKPNMASESPYADNFRTAMTRAKKMKFNIDLIESGASYTTYRIQGTFNILEEHGEFEDQSLADYTLNFNDGSTLDLTFLGVNNYMTGYLSKSVYDPRNIEADVFLLDNHSGNLNNIVIDGGTI